jgi:hypothetical protein
MQNQNSFIHGPKQSQRSLPSSLGYITLSGTELDSDAWSSCGFGTFATLTGIAVLNCMAVGVRGDLGGGASHGSCHFGPPLFGLFFLAALDDDPRDVLELGPKDEDPPTSGFPCLLRMRRTDHHLRNPRTFTDGLCGRGK